MPNEALWECLTFRLWNFLEAETRSAARAQRLSAKRSSFCLGKGLDKSGLKSSAAAVPSPFKDKRGLSLSLSLPFQKKGLEWKRAIFWMADTPRQVKQQEFPDSFDKNNCPAGDSLELGPGAYACL